MHREVVFASVAEERRRIADLLDDLDGAPWAMPSRCTGWARRSGGRRVR